MTLTLISQQIAPDLFGGVAALLYLLYLWLQLRAKAIETFPNRRVAALVTPAMGVHLIYAVLVVTTGSGISLSIWSSAVVMTFVAMLFTFYLYLVQGYRVLALVTVPLAIVSLFIGLLLTPIEGTPDRATYSYLPRADQYGHLCHVGFNRRPSGFHHCAAPATQEE